MEARARNSCHTRFVLVAAVLTGLVAAAATAAGQGEDRPGWSLRSPLPLPRSEVASAVLRGKIAVAGGFLSDGSSSRRVDLYDPALDRWARLPDLPIGVNHAMAAADGRRIYVVGGYADARALRRGFVLEGGVWRPLPLLPEARAAGGAAVVGGRLYVVGGVFAQGRLARDAYVLDRARRRWTAIAGPSPREHLGVAALNGRIYAVGGRSAGFDTNLDLTEVFSEGRWQTVTAVPGKRGGRASEPAVACSSLPGARPPAARSRRSTRSTRRQGSGARCPTFRRRGTGSQSRSWEGGSTRSAAARSRASR